tara:strand:- start:2066 stop:2257 length:192 start_codon:yes stop_codon:yes gene_type:complete
MKKIYTLVIEYTDDDEVADSIKETIEFVTNIDYEVNGVDISDYWDRDTLEMMDKHYISEVPKA